jgi:hypothetical protein
MPPSKVKLYLNANKAYVITIRSLYKLESFFLHKFIIDLKIFSASDLHIHHTSTVQA